MSGDNLPDDLSDSTLGAPWNAKDHLLGCPKRDGTEVCVCGHAKDPHGKEPGHRSDGVCQARVPANGLMCGCDGYEQPDCRCAAIRHEREAAKADAAEDKAKEGRYARAQPNLRDGNAR